MRPISQARFSHALTRRSLLRAASSAGLGFAAAACVPEFAGRMIARWRKGDPFSLGVAAGAPSADGFVLWTRLAPDPLSPDPAAPGGMTGGPVPVDYEIATDPHMASIVRRASALADPVFGYSVHEEVKGLEPGRSYWYRFLAGEAQSRVGRASTAPAPGHALGRLRLGFASCSNYEHGYFAAYRHMADEAPDYALFLGDYIYEYVDARPGTVRKHSDGVEASTLATYRNRYAQYRLDPDLQRLHAEVPALITWDDHEVQNDYADALSQTFDDPQAFLLRRAAAYQAFYEHMPLRASVSRPQGPDMRLYSRYTFGDLAQIAMLDGRQYRSPEACYGPPDRGGAHLETDRSCPERRRAGRSMIGMAQEAWLHEGLSASRARWNIVAQDVLMAQLRQKTRDGTFGYWTDDWDGYPAARTRLLRHIHRSRVENPVVLGGDIHSYWANDLKLDFDNPSSPVVASEFVGTSISAHGPNYERFAGYLPDNPHVRYFESRRRGYVSLEIEAERMTARLRAISDATDPNAAVETLKTFAVENGRAGVQAG